VTSIQMLSTHAFVGKLHQAILAEEAKTQGFKEVVERAKEAWVTKRARLQALQKLLEKLKKNKQACLDKQEQRFLDELASQAASRPTLVK